MKAILKKLYGNKPKTTKLKKVNLAIVEDIQKKYENLEVLNETFINKWIEAEKIIDELIIDSKTIFDESKSVQDELNELVNSIKEIGLEPDRVITNLIAFNDILIIKKQDLYMYVDQLKNKVDQI